MRFILSFIFMGLIVCPVQAESEKFVYDQKFIGQVTEKSARLKVAVSRFDVDLAVYGSLFNPSKIDPVAVAGENVSVKIMSNAKDLAEIEQKKIDRKSDAELLVSLLIDKLRKTEAFEVVERQDVNELVREINFQNSDWAKKDVVNQLGNISGVQYIVTGKLLMNKHEHRVGPGRYTLPLRIYDVSTGEVIASSTGQSDYLEKAVENAVRLLATDVHGGAWTCKVVKIDGDKALINAGFIDGIQKGDVFAVIREGEVIKDPGTQAVLGVVKNEIAKIRVEEILENNLSRTKVLNKKDEIVVGDIVSAKALEQKMDETEKWHEIYGGSSGEKKSLPAVKLEKASLSQMGNPDSLASDIVARASRAVVLILAASINEASQGSGFLISADGYILTNSHVVRGQKTVAVKLVEENKVYSDVEVVRDNPIRDMALLKIKSSDSFQPVVLGDSDQVQVGERVVVIGSPKGLENTVSDGLISAIRDDKGTKLLQTSAPISHGSSGGAMFNSQGEVVGITSAGYEDGQNLNFAVAINHAKQELIK